PYFLSVYVQQHAVKMAFYYLAFKIGDMLQPICLFVSKGILQHDLPILVILIGQSKSKPVQFVKKLLLRFNIIVKCLMKIKMVVRDIGEYATCKTQSGNTLLYDSV